MSTVYDTAQADLAAFCAAHDLTYAAEDPTPDGCDLPARYLLCTMISDPDSRFYGGKRTATDYRLQFDLVVPRADGCLLPALFDALETVLTAAGYLPQGNRRFRTDTVAQKAYIQKDYIKTMRRDG